MEMIYINLLWQTTPVQEPPLPINATDQIVRHGIP
jgi:hypothetical protein